MLCTVVAFANTSDGTVQIGVEDSTRAVRGVTPHFAIDLMKMARTWVRRFADLATLGGVPHHVGPSGVVIDGVDAELDIVVAGGGDTPSERTVLAFGEAKAGESVSGRHLVRLERVRAAPGARAADARLLLFGSAFAAGLKAADDQESAFRGLANES